MYSVVRAIPHHTGIPVFAYIVAKIVADIVALVIILIVAGGSRNHSLMRINSSALYTPNHCRSLTARPGPEEGGRGAANLIS